MIRHHDKILTPLTIPKTSVLYRKITRDPQEEGVQEPAWPFSHLLTPICSDQYVQLYKLKHSSMITVTRIHEISRSFPDKLTFQC